MDPISTINHICRKSFHLALLLGLLTIALAPFHMSGTRNVDIVRTLPNNQVEVRATPTVVVSPGDTLPVYRFNPGWKVPIGHLRVTELSEQRWLGTFDPDGYSWPMGIQGTIVAQQGNGRVTLNIGSAVRLKKGQRLSVFRDRQRIGMLLVGEVREDQAQATVARWNTPKLAEQNFVGLVVNEFEVANQVAWFEDAQQDTIDAALYGLVLLVWLWSLFSPIPGGLFFNACARARESASRVPSPVRHFATLLLGIPLVYVGGIVSWFGFTRTLGWITDTVALALPGTPIFPSWPLPATLPVAGPWFAFKTVLGDNHIMPTTLVLGLAWVVWLVVRRSSPALAAWRLTAYHPLPTEPGVRPTGVLSGPLYLLWSRLILPTIGRFWIAAPDAIDGSTARSRAVTRGLVNWTLHLVVFYAFGSTLRGFLLGNLRAIGRLGWGDAHLDFYSVGGFFHGLFTLLTQFPELDNASNWFQLFRLTLWTLTISGCLVGYGHTVVSVLWKPTAIRNIDLTPWAWLFNSICYGPLLGGIIHRIAPYTVGVDPYVTVGAYYWMCQVTELLLNLLYTLSIWNLGTMFGVMVDKGVRWNGFYSVVRHPSYTLEPLMFVILELNAFTTPAGWLAAAAYPIKYWLRSERDDQFMGDANPEYVEYRKFTPWKFIPGLY